MNKFQLKISSPFGEFTSIHGSYETLLCALYAYVMQEWDDVITAQYGSPVCLTRCEAIDAYFDCTAYAANPESFEVSSLPAA